MNCPLCDTPLSDGFICPNCGTPVDTPAVVTVPEPIPPTGHPGIFYENLISSQEVYDQEHRPPKPPSYAPVEKGIIAVTLVLLLCLMLTVYFAAGVYDPDAPALRGKGFSMDNRTFSIYYQNAYQRFLSQYSEDLPFDTDRSLKKQYYNVETGFTWEDYFISQAYPNAALTQRLVYAATRCGFTMPEEGTDNLNTAGLSLRQYAQSQNMTPEEYLQAMYGPQMTWDTYHGYLEDSILAQAFAEHLYTAQAGDADLSTQEFGAFLQQLLQDISCKQTRFAAAPDRPVS